MSNDYWDRCTKKNPCPECGKGDWCSVSTDGKWACCQRTPEGAVKQTEGGYLHLLRDDKGGGRCSPHHRAYRISSQEISEAHVERFTALAEKYQHNLTSKRCQDYAQSLGVSPESLRQLGVGYVGYDRYAWPMCDAEGRIIGIRIRTSKGKYCVRGSKTGLFLPQPISPHDPLLIVEGNTDCASGLSFGLASVGRPSCTGGTDILLKVCRGRGICIIADSDTPGQVGAIRLAEKLSICCPSVKVITPPQGIKDLRRWLALGLTKEGLREVISSTAPIMLEVA